MESLALNTAGETAPTGLSPLQRGGAIQLEHEPINPRGDGTELLGQVAEGLS